MKYLRGCLRAKIDGDISNRFLIHFMEVTEWSEEMKTDVRNESLALLSPKTEQHEIFPCNGSMRYKKRMWHWSELRFRILVLNWHSLNFITKRAFWKKYIKIYGVFLATYLRFSEVLFTHFITKILRLLLKKKSRLRISEKRQNFPYNFLMKELYGYWIFFELLTGPIQVS